MAPKGANGGMVHLPVAPLMHGATQWCVMGQSFVGSKIVLMAKFDPHEVWRLVGDEKVNSVMITGDAMGKPLIESLGDEGTEHDLSSLLAVVSSAALFSCAGEGPVLRAPAQPGDHRRHRVVGGRQQRHDGRDRRQHRHEERARPCTSSARPWCSTRTSTRSSPAPASSARSPARRHPARVLQRPEEDGRGVHSGARHPLRHARATTPRSKPTDPSPCSAAARSSSTPAARRSSPRRSSPPCAPTPTSWTPSSAARPTSAGARRWRPSSSRGPGHEVPTLGAIQEQCRESMAGLQGAPTPPRRRRGGALAVGQARLHLGRGTS